MGTTKKFPVTKDENKGLRTVTVDKQEEAKEYYIALVDKSTGTVNKVFKSSDVSRKVNLELIGPSQMSGLTMYLTGVANSDNRTMNPTKSGAIGVEIWGNYVNMVFSISGDFFKNKEFAYKKTNYYTNTQTLKVVEDSLFTIIGDQSYYDRTEISGVRVNHSQLTNNRTITFSESLGNQGPLAGIYSDTASRYLYFSGVLIAQKKVLLSSGTYITITRQPINESIDIQKSDLSSDGKINLSHQKFGEKLGYQNLGTYTLVSPVPGVQLSGRDLIFSKPGTYKLKVKWEYKESLSVPYIITEGDEITINYDVVNIGEVKFRLDPRIKSDTSINWINTKGDVGTEISTIASSTNYIGLRQVEGTFSNLSSTNITDIISMEGRPEKYPNGIYNTFRTLPGATIDEAGMKTGVNLTNLVNELVISKNNSENPQMLDNKFELLGANGQIYAGNIKEEYGPDKYYEGTATLEMKQHPTGTYSRWSPGVTGDAVSNSPIESSMVISTLKLGGTKLFESRGFGSGATITKLIVKQNGVAKESTSIVEKKIQVNNLDNHIGINLVNANVFISKNTDNTKENTYEIFPYYNNVLLGKLTVKITNAAALDIGEVTFKVDPRLSKHYSGGVYHYGGDLYPTELSSTGALEYPELLKTAGAFKDTGGSINKVVSVEGRPLLKRT
ncbi:MAG: hypothetical protein ACRC6K_03150, partial [Fusobacteriaceae bacterium]